MDFARFQFYKVRFIQLAFLPAIPIFEFQFYKVRLIHGSLVKLVQLPTFQFYKVRLIHVCLNFVVDSTPYFNSIKCD